MNIIWRLDSIDVVKLARWVRCLFQLALTTKNEIAEFLLDQVSTLAQDDKMVRRSRVPALTKKVLMYIEFSRLIRPKN